MTDRNGTDQTFNELRAHLLSIEHKVDRLVRAVEGETPFYNGIAKRLAQVEAWDAGVLEKQIIDVDRRVDRIWYMAVGAGAAAGVLGGVIQALVLGAFGSG